MLSVEIIKRSFFAIINNWDVAFKVSGFWWPIIVVLTLPYAIQPPIIDPITGSIDYLPFMFAQSVVLNLLYGVIYAAVCLAGFSVMAIGWHRFLINGWQPNRLLMLEKDWPWGQYFWAGFLLSLIAIPIAVIPTIFVYADPANMDQELIGYNAIGVNFMIQLAVLLPFTFLGLILPSIAIDQSKTGKNRIGFSQSWGFAKSNGVEVLMLVVMAALIYTIVISTTEQIFGSGEIRHASATSILGFFVGSIETWLITMFGVGLLSELYKALVQTRKSQEATA